MRAELLTTERFAPFGTVIAHGGGEGRRYLPEVFASGAPDPRPAVWVNRLTPVRLPIVVSRLERHPHGAQSFAPLGAGRLLVIVCGAGEDGRPDPGRLAAFVAPAGVGVVYRPGVWHHGLAGLGAAMETLVVFAAHGVAGETDYADLAAPALIEEPDDFER